MNNIFGCCPKKPKITLDYVIKWVEEADKTLKELVEWKNAIDSDIESLVREAVENYDWSDLPQEALDHKADKVQEATEGDFASLDSYGNLLDSGKKASDFAPTSHFHELIKREGTGTNAGDSAVVVAGANSIEVEIEKSGVLYNAEINTTNFANLLRALQDPAAPISEGNSLITNGQVFTALQGKADKVTGATDGNLAGLDEYGNLTDSGKKASDFAANDHNHNSEYAPKNHTHTIYDVENLGDFYKNMAARVEAIEGQKTTSWTTIATIGPANVYDEHNLYGFDGIQSLEVGQRIRLVNHYNSSVVLDGSIVGVGGAPYRVNVTAVINISGGDYDLQVASFS